MKKVLAILAFVLFITSLASAEIIIKQPKELYNLGEIISVPITIKSTAPITEIFQMDLICEGHQLNFYKNGVALSTGQEIKLNPSLILSKTLINELKGNCVIKAILGEEYIVTNEFEISETINIHQEVETPSLFPQENLIIKGGATKKSGAEINGFVKVEIFSETANNTNSSYLQQTETINNGFFKINISLPQDMKAENYIADLNIYEKDSQGEITNHGSSSVLFTIKQLPISIDINLENSKIIPGELAKITIILKDQTQENINSITKIKIKNSKNSVVEQVEINTGEIFEFPTESSTPVSNFTIEAETQGISASSQFSILEKISAKTKIVNNTLIVSNFGNTIYCNKTIVVKIGSEIQEIPVCLEVGKEETYKLSAPDGEYEIEVITDEEKITENVALTGKAIDVKKATQGSILTRHPLIWIFVIGILGFMVTSVYRKGFKRSFVGKIYRRKHPTEKKEISVKKLNKISLVKTTATLALSIKGEKQNAVLICLKIKNFEDVCANKEIIKENLSKINKIAENKKIMIYENQENIFFILSAMKTKTFKNEKKAVEVARKIKEILDYNNKLFKQKISYGISIGKGQIVAKAVPFQFTPFSDLMTRIKKIASMSEKEILLSEEIRTTLSSDVKAEKITKDKTSAFKITEYKKKNEHEKFIKKFMERLGK